MDKTFLNARSPLRLLEQSLHGGLGPGNLGLVLAGHGVGKTSFLVGVALDSLMRGEPVLHVALGQSVERVRDRYDTLFREVASHARLDDEAIVRSRLDQLRGVRAYSPGSFDAAVLREALKHENEAGHEPRVVILEGYDVAVAQGDELEDLRRLAREQQLEIWFSVACESERIDGHPAEVGHGREAFDVILALEPHADKVALKALKDHDNPDVATLRVALDPNTLLLRRG